MTVTIVRERAVLVYPIDKVIASELYIEEVWDTKENIAQHLYRYYSLLLLLLGIIKLNFILPIVIVTYWELTFENGGKFPI